MRYLHTRTDISCIKRITVLSILTISKPVHLQAKSNNRRKFHQFTCLLKYTYTQSYISTTYSTNIIDRPYFD